MHLALQPYAAQQLQQNNLPAVVDVHAADVEADQRALDRFSTKRNVSGSFLAFHKDALVHVILFFVQTVQVPVDRKALRCVRSA